MQRRFPFLLDKAVPDSAISPSLCIVIKKIGILNWMPCLSESVFPTHYFSSY